MLRYVAEKCSERESYKQFNFGYGYVVYLDLVQIFCGYEESSKQNDEARNRTEMGHSLKTTKLINFGLHLGLYLPTQYPLAFIHQILGEDRNSKIQYNQMLPSPSIWCKILTIQFSDLLH